jgi:uncharacterized membrane protein
MSINPKTTAAIGDHPLHPMLIPFPIACLVGAPIADLPSSEPATVSGQEPQSG